MANGLFTLKQQLQGLIQKAWAGSQKTPAVEYLVVAGGGGGGGSYSGGDGSGGGAGGLLQGISNITSGTSYTITIGSGGTAGSASVTTAQTNGGNSVFGSITALGGGYGAASVNANSGGSGGGATLAGSNAPIGQGTSGQGNAGGTAQGVTANFGSGGGGGAGTVGLNGSTTNGGNGGAGIASAINGTVTAYAGGGGAGIYTSGTVGTGGVGGGGAGSVGANATSGTANTGGGGGGAGFASSTHYAGGTGGSGIVIISYPDIYSAPASFGGANSPTASTSGSGSVYLNGSSYINYAGQSNFAFSTNAFTIEFWVYSTSYSSQINFYDSRPASTNGYYPSIYSGSDGSLNFYVNNANVISSSASALTANTWYHIAVSKSGSSTKMFLNGTQVGSTYSDTNTYLNGASSPVVGGQGVTRGSYLLNGYISNLRVVNGTGVYTSNFTAPASPLTPIANTVLLLGTVSPNQYLDSSTNAYIPTITGTPAWNQLSPFATGLGYKNRVYTWTGSGTVTF